MLEITRKGITGVNNDRHNNDSAENPIVFLLLNIKRV